MHISMITWRQRQLGAGATGGLQLPSYRPARVSRASGTQPLVVAQVATGPAKYDRRAYDAAWRQQELYSSIRWQGVRKDGRMDAALRQYYDAWSDVSALDSLDEVASKGVVYSDSLDDGQGDYLGLSSLRKYLAGMQASHPLLRFEVVSC